MYATYAVMSMTRLKVMLIAASLQEQPSKTSLKIGFAQSVV